MEEWLNHFLRSIGPWAYAVIGAGVGLECAALLGLIMPGETLAILGGFFAARHDLSLPVVLIVVAASAIVGDNIGFEMGRRLGRGWLLRVGRHLRLKAPDVDRIEQLFQRHGGLAVAIARYVTFGRAIAPYVAGTSGMGYGQFLLYNALGGIVWAAASVFVGYGFAAVWNVAKHWVMGITIGLAVAFVAAAVIWWWRRQHRRGSSAGHGSGAKRRGSHPKRSTRS